MKSFSGWLLYFMGLGLPLCLGGCTSIDTMARDLSRFAATPISTWSSYTTADGLAERHVSSIAIDEAGVVWLGTWDGLSRLEGENWITYTIEDGLAGNKISSLAIGPYGALWAGTDGNGVSSYDAQTQTWMTYTSADGLAGNRIWDIALGPENELWFAALDGGISRFHPKEGRFITYTNQDGLPGNSVWSLALAPDGTLWAGMNGSGLVHFDGADWVAYTAESTQGGLRSDLVYALAVTPDNVVWAGTWNGGISSFDGERWTHYPGFRGAGDYRTQPNSNNIYSAVSELNGAVWFGGIYGVSRFDGRVWRTYHTNDGLIEMHGYSLAIAKDGTIWVGTENGVSHSRITE